MPFVVETVDGEEPRGTGEEERAGFVDCRRPVTLDDIVLAASGFLD